MVGKLVTEKIFQTGESRIKLVIKTPFLKKIFKKLNFNLHILGFPSILIVEKEWETHVTAVQGKEFPIHQRRGYFEHGSLFW